jgi:hypothetical protein
MLAEHIFHFDVVFRWVTTLVLQLHPNLALELVILREYGDHRNLENRRS